MANFRSDYAFASLALDWQLVGLRIGGHHCEKISWETQRAPSTHAFRAERLSSRPGRVSNLSEFIDRRRSHRPALNGGISRQSEL